MRLSISPPRLILTAVFLLLLVGLSHAQDRGCRCGLACDCGPACCCEPPLVAAQAENKPLNPGMPRPEIKGPFVDRLELHFSVRPEITERAAWILGGCLFVGLCVIAYMVRRPPPAAA